MSRELTDFEWRTARWAAVAGLDPTRNWLDEITKHADVPADEVDATIRRVRDLSHGDPEALWRVAVTLVAIGELMRDVHDLGRTDGRLAALARAERNLAAMRAQWKELAGR